MMAAWAVAAIALTVAVAYAGLVVGLYVGQRRLLFRPDRTRAVLAPPYRPVTSVTADGLALRHGWAPGPSGNGALLVLHGNAGHLGHRQEKFAPLHAAGWSVLLAGYRGYGGNPGEPTEDGLIADAQSALDWLAERGVSPQRVVVYGESLGTGVATALAARNRVAGLVLESGFTAISDVAQRHHWYVPARRLLRDRFECRARITAVQAPVLMLHGTADTVIPFDLGERLYAAARMPKSWVALRGAGHNDVWELGGGEATRRFLASLAAEMADQTCPERV